MDNKDKSKKIESLIETSRQVEAEANKSRQKPSKPVKEKKKNKSVFLSPSIMMSIICIITIFIALVAAAITTVRMANKEAHAMATPYVETDTTPVPTPFPTPLPIPNVEDTTQLSKDLRALVPTVEEWCKREEDPDDKGLYFIKNDAKYLIYQVNSTNICDSGYNFKDFEYIWINSEENDFAAVINISGEKVDLSDYNIRVRDDSGVYAPRVIINCYEAKTVDISNAVVTGTILAPEAEIICDGTYVYGQLIGASYKGNLEYKRDIVFSEYLNVMSVTHGIEFESKQFKKRVIEILKNHDDQGLYDEYNMDTVVLEKDIKRVMELDLSGLQVSSFGEDLKHFSHVISLSVANTNLKSLDLTLFPNLQALYINNTAIREINLSPVPALRILDMSNTRMNTMPDFSLVPRLEYLNANNTALSYIDYNNLKNLKSLSISGNPLIREFNVSTFANIEHLDIGNCNIRDLDLSGLEKLKYLKCSGNDISYLDLDVAPQLSTVEAYMDSLTEIKAISFHSRNQNAKIYCNEGTFVKR